MENHENKRRLLSRRAHFRLSMAFVAVIIIALVSPVSAGPARTLQATAQSLNAGSLWSTAETINRTATGKGSDSGTWTRNWSQSDNFVVLNRTATTISVAFSGTDSWSSTATDTWVSDSGGPTKHGTDSWAVIYAVDLGTYMVSAVSNKDFSDEVGLPAWFLLNPNSLTAGGTVLLTWNVPNSNATSETLTAVPWTVGQDTVSVKGNQLGAWKVTYTGEQFGHWKSGNLHSTGTVTETDYFDSVYGIWLGYSASGNFTFDREGGGWKETYRASGWVSDTNLVFTVSSTLTASSANSVNGVAVTGTPFYLLMGGVVTAVFATIVVAIALVRRKRGASTPHEPPTTPAAPKPVETVQKPSLLNTRKYVTHVEPHMNYCANCRAKLPADAEFCGECGYPAKATT